MGRPRWPLANCPLDGAASDDDTAGAVSAVRAAFTAGIYTFVVGIATTGPSANGVDASSALAMLAEAGGLPRAGDPPHYAASTAQELASVLTTVVQLANRCTFQIAPTPTSDGTTSLGWIEIWLDEKRIPRDPSHANGWDYSDATRQAITLYGAACDAITAGAASAVGVTFRCPIE